MRPRGVPRGSVIEETDPDLHFGASMRPRGVPRGSRFGTRDAPSARSSFNEAAGRTPRKRARSGRAAPAEPQGFNEAAGRTPRKRPLAWVRGSATPSFNEAAGRTPRKRTARKSLCVNGLPWQLRAVSRRRVATARAARTPGVFLDHNYPVVKDLPALRALPGVAAAPQRSIRERRAAHQSYDDRFPPHGPFGTPFFQADDARFDAIGDAEGSTRTT